VHRDLKLEYVQFFEMTSKLIYRNLLLDEKGRIKITDFGFCNYFEQDYPVLMRTSCGSPCYAAPELVLSDGYEGTAADIWSCGIILFAMLCGYLPFDDDPQNPEGSDVNRLYHYILHTDLSFPNHVSESARSLILSMLKADPAERIQMEDILIHPWMSKAPAIETDKKLQPLKLLATSPKEQPRALRAVSDPLHCRLHQAQQKNKVSMVPRSSSASCQSTSTTTAIHLSEPSHQRFNSTDDPAPWATKFQQHDQKIKQTDLKTSFILFWNRDSGKRLYYKVLAFSLLLTPHSR
jgi:serine/threonine protein kinase